jgi:hypothetical protein
VEAPVKLGHWERWRVLFWIKQKNENLFDRHFQGILSARLSGTRYITTSSKQWWSPTNGELSRQWNLSLTQELTHIDFYSMKKSRGKEEGFERCGRLISPWMSCQLSGMLLGSIWSTSQSKVIWLKQMDFSLIRYSDIILIRLLIPLLFPENLNTLPFTEFIRLHLVQHDIQGPFGFGSAMSVGRVTASKTRISAGPGSLSDSRSIIIIIVSVSSFTNSEFVNVHASSLRRYRSPETKKLRKVEKSWEWFPRQNLTQYQKCHLKRECEWDWEWEWNKNMPGEVGVNPLQQGVEVGRK